MLLPAALCLKIPSVLSVNSIFKGFVTCVRSYDPLFKNSPHFSCFGTVTLQSDYIIIAAAGMLCSAVAAPPLSNKSAPRRFRMACSSSFLYHFQ